MFYGFVGGPIRTVFRDFKFVERAALIYPYSSYRKFWNEGSAWNWVMSRPHRKMEVPESIYKYGNLFNSHYLTIEYFIDEERVVANVITKKLGNVKLYSEDPNVVILNKTNRSEIEIKSLKLNPDLINSHLIAIVAILDLVGAFVDVEVILPNHSIFFALTRYSGTKKSVIRLVDRIKRRQGEIAWTLKDYSMKET